MVDKTTEQVVKKKAPNPTGKGGFKEHPELINAGGRPKNIERFDYWLQVFKDLSKKEFDKLENQKKGDWPMAKFTAYERYKKIRELREFQEVANRTEGMPKQTVKQEFDDNVTEIEYHLKRGQDETHTGGD